MRIMATIETSYFDRLLAPVAECFTTEVAERLLALSVDPSIQARISELADKANEGQLSEEERAEYEDFVDAVDMIGVLQAQARKALKSRT
jgi:hypothetical protein